MGIIEETLAPIIKHFKGEYGLTESQLLGIYHEEEILVPVNIFSYNLSPLEALVKYLKENKRLRNSKIAAELNRKNQVIWISYRNAKKKRSEAFSEEAKLKVPLSIFKESSLSILETLVLYLKKNNSIKELSVMLKKSPSTIYTVLNRARKKENG